MIENDKSYDFQLKIDKDTEIKVSDFSLKCTRSNLVTVWILRRIEGRMEKIGIANVQVNPFSRRAKWCDIKIGSDAKFLPLGGLPLIPNPDYRFRKFRGKGIGSKTVQLVLEYLRQNGIEEVYGKISDRDDFEKASNFWKKIGFTVTPYDEPRGSFVARIRRKI